MGDLPGKLDRMVHKAGLDCHDALSARRDRAICAGCRC